MRREPEEHEVDIVRDRGDAVFPGRSRLAEEATLDAVDPSQAPSTAFCQRATCSDFAGRAGGNNPPLNRAR